jgi:hypothetical protein
MKKSKIVSYTSEELKQMPDESDWAAADAMTDEEIEAAIASDPEEAALHEGWMKRARVVRSKPRFVMCIDNKGYPLDLTVHKVYKVIAHTAAEQHKMVRIVDDSGKEHLHSASRFVPVSLSVEAERNFAVVAV